MATALQNNVADIIAQTNAPSFPDASRIDFQADGINTMNDEPSTDDGTENSQSEKIVQQTEKIVEQTELTTSSKSPPETQQSNDNENTSLNDAPNKRVVKKKFRNFLDSDSEEEGDIVSSILGKSKSSEESRAGSDLPDENNVETLYSNVAKGKSIGRLIDSDSDDDVVEEPKNADVSDDNSLTNTVTKKISALVDSESEDNDPSKNSATSSPEQGRRKVTSEHKKKRKVEKTAKKSKLSSLIDTDSEGDDEVNDVNKSPGNGPDNTEPVSKKNAKSVKKRTGSQRASKDEAMRQIHSETQRLIRSTEVSLPYHRPKQRSLQDFLNRKKFIPALPEGLTTAAKVKMSSEIVSKVLEEKEKEAELFYKSSDSDEETIDSTPANVGETNESSTRVDEINIEETQKIIKNDVQNAHNKKEIIKQGAVDIGVPRKLFVEDGEEFAEVDETVGRDVEDEESVESDDPRKKPKATKQGMREGSVPRKLFSSDYDEGVESQSKIYEDSPALIAKKTTDSERSEIIEGQSESVDEGIESLSQDKEFSSLNPIIKESHRATEPDECNTAAEVADETLKIFDTPFISNKDVAKLNEKDKAPTERVDFGEMLIGEDNASDPRSAPGHVFGLPPPDMEEICPKTTENLNVKNKSSSTVSNVCPKLRGAPGMVIDFSDEVKPNTDGVQSLLDRFYRHSVVNKPAEVSKTMTVLHTERTADGLQVVEQVIPYKLPVNDRFTDKELSKPGAKHSRLKSELIERMAKKRGEEWKLKEKQQKEEEEEEEDDIEEEYDSEEDAKLVEEEVPSSGESEPEEDDMPESKRRKTKKPSEFVDEEAEVSGEEEDDEAMQVGSDDEEEDDDEDGGGSASRDVDEDDDAVDSLSDVDAELDTARITKRVSRIVKAFEDDSNSLPDISSQTGVDSCEKTFQRTRTDVDMFESEDVNNAWLSDNEADFPPSQVLPRDHMDARSQACKTPLTAINVLRFVSPMTQLTALNSFANSPRDCSATKSQSSSSQRIATLSTETTPADKGTAVSSDSEKRIGFQKKLFQEPAGTVNEEELMDLCSGRFTGIETDDGGSLAVASNGKLSASSETSQLLGLSSGSFFSQAIDSDGVQKITKPDVDETSQDIRLTLDDDDEASRDNAVGKEAGSEATSRKFNIVSSSDDDNEVDKLTTKKKRLHKKRRKVKQLELSDDEDEAESSNEDEEEECELSCNDTEDKYVDYDSEENEVVIVPKKDIKKVAANFLDAEAELSESEWGSADEDEKGLDKLELEEGDEEEIDENQMRDQLGKMHVRQILDDDQRDVRMLQELLFEDGDLHTDGSGRERKFKWKNIDQLGEDGNTGPVTDGGEANGDQLEEENDLEWRKLRLERDKFIQEKMKIPSDEIHDELTPDSTIFKLGMRVLKKKKSSQCAQKESDEPIAKKPVVPRTVMDFLASPAGDESSKIVHKAVKRGSFLARGEESLARLAVHIKHTETTITARKNPGNFVFACLSPSVATANRQNDVTESEEAPTTNEKARKRKPPAGTTPRTVKKAKIDESRSSGKKLF